MKIIRPQNNLHTATLKAIAIILSSFNETITEGLLQGALKRLRERAFPEEMITIIYVPGAVEIGLVAQQLAGKNDYQALICLGAVIRGETDHYDYVCQQVSDSCQQVALATRTPVIFGVLTTRTPEEARARASQNRYNKGREAVDAALDMISILSQI